MDCNSPNDFQMPTRMIKLRSSDGAIFQVEVKVAQLSLLIRNMLDDLGVDETEVIPMPQNAPEISGTILGKILQWANHHKDDPVEAEDDEKVVKPTDDISSWDAEFLQVDRTTLFHMIRAAKVLNIKGLLDVTCKKVAKKIKGMSPQEVRKTLNIENDFNPEEEEQVRKENNWCEGFDSRTDDRKAGDGSVLNETHFLNLRHHFNKVAMRILSSVFKYFVREMENEGDEVVKDCLKNSVVVRKIFQHSSNPELLELSKVNKMWSYEARLILRHRGGLVAVLSCRKTRPCHEVFGAFGEDLRKMNVVPYSGLSLVISSKSIAARSQALDSTSAIIVARLALKQLTLRLPENWWYYKDCPAFVLLRNILQGFSGVLEELTLDIKEDREEFVEHFVQDCSFSALKVLKLKDKYCAFDESYTDYMRALVIRAPKLQELHTDGSINLEENVLEGSEAVLLPGNGIRAPFDEITESVVETLRLKHVELLYTGPDFNLDLFNRVAPMLLQASCTTTLSGMRVDGILAVPLMSFGICLENITDLEICLNYDLSEPFQWHILMIMKEFYFERMFPNLDKVRIYYSFECIEPSRDHMHAIFEQVYATLRDPLPNRVASVKELDLDLKCISASAVQFFAQMFPDIQKLVIKDGEGDTPYGSIWKHWPCLTELQVEGKFLNNIKNLDSIFCGIFPQEIAQLREKDEEYLKRVNIVPVMPAITSLKNLKTFTLKVTSVRCGKQRDEPFVDDGACIFSKVTGLIAFARSPSFSANLEFLTDEVLPVSHLEHFSSVKCVDIDQMWAAYDAKLKVVGEIIQKLEWFGDDSETD